MRRMLITPAAVAALTAAALPTAPVFAQAPPSIINYQGVLLDNATGAPITADQSMAFRYHNSSTGTTDEILLELHTVSDVGPVTVANGLFNVQLGTGLMLDGSGVFPNDPHLSLAEVFRDFGEVWLEVAIKVGEGPGGPIFETLTPRTRIVSAAYSLNAGALNGKDAGSFLDTSATAQTKQGDLTVSDLTVAGNQIRFGAPGSLINAIGLGVQVLAGTAPTDIIHLAAGNTSSDGSLLINGNGAFDMYSGDGSFSFFNHIVQPAIETASLSPLGDLQFDGDLTVSGNEIRFGNPGVRINAVGPLLQIYGGDSAGDDILLVANQVATGASIRIESGLHLFSTDGGIFKFQRTNITPFETLAEIRSNGDLSIGGTLFQNQFDLAEAYLMGEPMQPGDIVRLHPGRKGAVLLSAGVEDPTVLGVVSESPGVVMGGALFAPDDLERMWGPELKARFLEDRERLLAARIDAAGGAVFEELALRHESEALEEFYWKRVVPVALAGRVPVKVDASFGAIVAGDALSPSPVPGVAMKADGRGPVIGIALESFGDGRGKVEMFVSRGQAGATEAVVERAQRRLVKQVEDVERRTPDPVTGLQSMPGHMQLVLDQDADDEARFSIFRDGREGQLGAEVFRVDEQGNLFTKGSVRPASMDIAEFHPVAESVEAGDVLVADREHAGRLKLGREAEDQAVVGIVSSEPGVLLGSGLERFAAEEPEMASELEQARTLGDRASEARLWREIERRFQRRHAAIALGGTVPCKVDAGFGAIRVGDLLTTSPTLGHAMRSDDREPGTILGKALEPLESGTGVIKVLVMLR